MSHKFNRDIPNAPLHADAAPLNRYRILRKLSLALAFMIAVTALALYSSPALLPYANDPAPPQDAVIVLANDSEPIAPRGIVDDVDNQASKKSDEVIAVTPQAEEKTTTGKPPRLRHREHGETVASGRTPRASSTPSRKPQIRNNSPASHVAGSSSVAAGKVEFWDFEDGVRLVRFSNKTTKLTYPGSRDALAVGSYR